MMNMNIGRMVLTALVAFGLLLVGGCGVRDEGVPRTFARRMDTIRESLMRGGGGFSHLKEFEATDRLFDEIPNKAARQATALAFGDMLLSLDLEKIPYQSRSTAVHLYRKYLCQGLELMNRGRISPRIVMNRYFEGLMKYRAACFGISMTGHQEGERREEYMRRRECARGLRDDYKLALSIFERFWLPNLSRYLPPEYHDEFRRRLKAFEIPEMRPKERQSSQTSEAGDAR